MELILSNIRKSFEKKEVLKGINFTFEKGKIYGLLGRNGAGKTTLFNCLSRETEVDSGKAILRTGSQEKGLKDEDIGYVFSTAILPEFLTGYEFIRFYMDIHGDKITSSMTPHDYFDMIKIDREDRNRLIRGYSHGMKNKLQMLMFIIARPPVILLDEPLTSLDVVIAHEIKKLLLDIRSEHIIIFSTHILQLATDLCDELIVLNGGTLEQLDHRMLKDKEFEDKIIAILSEEK
ncbi:MAG: yxlF1 [Herbinix sp.]|jgi:ABC-2 type transport system ATP-binding protein|nr:yxlF1 [Herbinix sp.]